MLAESIHVGPLSLWTGFHNHIFLKSCAKNIIATTKHVTVSAVEYRDAMSWTWQILSFFPMITWGREMGDKMFVPWEKDWALQLSHWCPRVVYFFLEKEKWEKRIRERVFPETIYRRPNRTSHTFIQCGNCHEKQEAFYTWKISVRKRW